MNIKKQSALHKIIIKTVNENKSARQKYIFFYKNLFLFIFKINEGFIFDVLCDDFSYFWWNTLISLLYC